MPASYSVDRERGLILVVAVGRLTGEEILSEQRRMTEDPAIGPGLDMIWDARAVGELEADREHLMQLSESRILSSGTRRAIVVAKDETFGVARIFELMRGDSPETTQVFRSMDDALVWLGRDGEPA